MTYQESEWIAREMMRLVKCYHNYQFKEYNHVISQGIAPSDLYRMDLNEVKEMIDNCYGVYQVGDIVKVSYENQTALITYIDSEKAETMHDVEYHVLYLSGKVKVVHISNIRAKIGNVKKELDSIKKNLHKYASIQEEQLNMTVAENSDE